MKQFREVIVSLSLPFETVVNFSRFLNLRSFITHSRATNEQVQQQQQWQHININQTQKIYWNEIVNKHVKLLIDNLHDIFLWIWINFYLIKRFCCVWTYVKKQFFFCSAGCFFNKNCIFSSMSMRVSLLWVISASQCRFVFHSFKCFLLILIFLSFYFHLSLFSGLVGWLTCVFMCSI